MDSIKGQRSEGQWRREFANSIESKEDSQGQKKKIIHREAVNVRAHAYWMELKRLADSAKSWIGAAAASGYNSEFHCELHKSVRYENQSRIEDDPNSSYHNGVCTHRIKRCTKPLWPDQLDNPLPRSSPPVTPNRVMS